MLASRAYRHKRLRRVLAALGVFSLLPTLLAVVYYGFIASSQYPSVAVVSVAPAAAADAPPDPKRPHHERGIEVVRSYVTSRAMLEALSADHGLRADYQSADFWSRLPADAGSEEAYAYYLEHLTVRPESDATLSIEVLAFSPDRAREIAQAIVTRAGTYLEEESEQTRRALIEPAERAVEEAKQRLIEVDARAAGELERGVAERRLEAALVALEVAQADAAKRKRRLMVVAAPSLPSEASRPRRWWSIVTVFVTTVALGGLLLLLSDIVREHARL